MHQQNVQIVEMNLLVQIMGSSRKTFPQIFDMRRVDVAINQIKMWENLGCVEKRKSAASH